MDLEARRFLSMSTTYSNENMVLHRIDLSMRSSDGDCVEIPAIIFAYSFSDSKKSLAQESIGYWVRFSPISSAGNCNATSYVWGELVFDDVVDTIPIELVGSLGVLPKSLFSEVLDRIRAFPGRSFADFPRNELHRIYSSLYDFVVLNKNRVLVDTIVDSCGSESNQFESILYDANASAFYDPQDFLAKPPVCE